MDLTVFIRTRNEARLIRRCLEGVFSQKTDLQFQVIVLDSTSEDETQAIVKEFDVELYQIPKEIFSYSKALNFGVQLATGDLFVALSGHCVPVDDSWLEELVRPLLEDSAVGASFSRQLPWPDVSPPERALIEAVFPAQGYSVCELTFTKGVAADVEPYQLLTFSNASACIRRSLLIKRPFLELPFAEDRAFVYECITAGSAVIYSPESKVYHSHLPDLADFRQIAKSAEIARAQINEMISADHALELRGYSLLPLKQLVKIPATIVYVVLMSFAALFRLYPVRNGCSSYLRLVRYYFACIGTTLGKFDAARALDRTEIGVATPADPSQLMREVSRP